MLAMKILMVLTRIFRVFKIWVERDLGKTSVPSFTFMKNLIILLTNEFLVQKKY